MQALEMTGTLDANGWLLLDQPVQVPHSGRVRIILLLEDSSNSVATEPDAPASPTELQPLIIRQLHFDPAAKPIWELAAELSAQVPDEEWRKLPTDLARRFDEYQKQKQRQGQD